MSKYFDMFDQYNIPDFILVNPNGDELHVLQNCSNRKIKMLFSGISEISFTAPRYVNGMEMPYYHLLEGRRRVFIEDIGYFIITEVKESSDGLAQTKDIIAQSIVIEFTMKDVVKFDNTMALYDVMNPDKSLLHYIVGKVRGWTLGNVSMELHDIHRRLDVSNASLYNFMMKEVQDAYQCIFQFDIVNRQLHVRSLKDALRESNIYLSHDNLIQTVDVRQITEEIVTALSVTGRDKLSINQVNPLGTDTIYNFSYYKKEGWMSRKLVTAINAWEAKIESNRVGYSVLLTSLRTRYLEYATMQTELSELETAAKVAEDALKVAIEAGQPTEELKEALDLADAAVLAKQNQINAKKAQIDTIIASLKTINELVSFESNFTTAQLDELDKFIYTSTYNNKNFLITDIMTPIEIQDQAEKLFEQATSVLGRVSQPLYEFKIKMDNLLFIKEFEPFMHDIVLGSYITIDMDDYFVYPILLGIEYNYDNPKDLELLFANRLRLASKEVQLGELLSDMNDTSTKVSFNSDDWDDWNTSGESAVKEYLREALDEVTRRLIGTEDNEITIGANGIIGRRRKGSTTPVKYEPEQLWITSNVIGFTDDNWTTTKTAIGKILSPSWKPTPVNPTPRPADYNYGVATEVLVGNLLIGENLLIENAGGTFKVNSSGAELIDAKFVATGRRSRVTIDTSDDINNFKIETKKGTAWKDVITVTTGGDLIVDGSITAVNGDVVAKSGKIGAITIEPILNDTNAGIRAGQANNPVWYIRPNKVKIGGMEWNSDGNTTKFKGHVEADSGTFKGRIEASEGTFSGTVNASKLSGKIDWSNITGYSAEYGFGKFFNSGGGYNFSGFAGNAGGISLSPSLIGYGGWNFGSGNIGTAPNQSGELAFTGGGTVSGHPITISSGSYIMLSSGDVRISGGATLRNGHGSDRYLPQSESDVRYSIKGHTHSGYIKNGDTPTFNGLFLEGAIRANNALGQTINVKVNTPTGAKTLVFVYGILTRVL